MDKGRVEKIFPSYFKYFEMPVAAREQEIEVYRACPTRKLERESFLNTYEQNGFRNSVQSNTDDPQEYCVSTYFRLNDIKRFVVIDSKYQPPWALAKGHTSCRWGLSCKTSDWKPKFKGSHVDYWLYKKAEPWKEFELTDYAYEHKNETISRGR